MDASIGGINGIIDRNRIISEKRDRNVLGFVHHDCVVYVHNRFHIFNTVD